MSLFNEEKDKQDILAKGKKENFCHYFEKYT